MAKHSITQPETPQRQGGPDLPPHNQSVSLLTTIITGVAGVQIAESFGANPYLATGIGAAAGVVAAFVSIHLTRTDR